MNSIALIWGVSEQTVRRQQEIYGLPTGRDHYFQLSDTQLDQPLSDIMEVHVIPIVLLSHSSFLTPLCPALPLSFLVY